MLSHRGAAGDVELDPGEESLGTMVWLGLSGPILDSIAHGDVLLVDEIAASLHPALVTKLVKLLIIFNSHEASLLGDSTTWSPVFPGSVAGWRRPARISVMVIAR